MSAATRVTEPNLIELSLPADTSVAATLRIMVASLGADVGCSIDEIDDIRLAATEVFASAADVDPGGRLTVTFGPTPGRLQIGLRLAGSTPIELDDLAATIVSALVDVQVDDGAITLSKRADEGGAS